MVRRQTADSRRQQTQAVREYLCCKLPSAVCRLFTLLFVLVGTIACQTVSGQTADVGRPSLDCTFRGGNGIFAPGQSVIMDVTLQNTTAPSVLRVTLTDHSQEPNLTLASFDTQIIPNTPLPVSFVTPEKEGAYTITLTSTAEARTRRPLLMSSLPMTMANDCLVSRKIVVLAPQASPRHAGTWTLTETHVPFPYAEYRLNGAYRLNEDSPSRRLLPTLPHLPKLGDLPKPTSLLRLAPSGRHDSSTLPPDLAATLGDYTNKPLWLSSASAGHITEKSERNSAFSAISAAEMDGYSWFSMPLNVEAGKPYLLEIGYPVNVPQTLGVAVVEGIFSGAEGEGKYVNTAATIHVAEEIVQETSTETVATHQLLFWGGRGTELVLINHKPNQEALFRNVRFSRITMPGQPEDSRLPKLFEGTAQRKRIGQIVGEGDVWYRENRHWQGFFEESSRLMDILHRGGYDGVTITVLSHKSSLFTPNVQNEKPDDLDKNLELIFRRFDNEGLTFIPAIEFNMPIPSLEQLAKQYPAIIEEIYIGNPEQHQYNLLHPAVQQAMTEIVGELVDRFSAHPSFGGVAIVLSPESYAQLPFALYPPDDHTWEQFRRDTEQPLGMAFPDEQQLRQTMPIQQFLAQKGAERIRFLQSDDKRIWEAWVRWRMAKVSGFYADLAKRVQTADGRRQTAAEENVLYLLGGTMLDSVAIQQYCAPTLPTNFATHQAIQLLGFDLPLLAKTESLHFLKPVQIATVPNSGGKNYSYESLNSAETAPLFSKSGMMSGVQFVHTGDTRTDTVGGSLFVTTPAHIQSRKRFVQQLAQADVAMFMDGGVSLPFGQESAMFDLLDTYRRLPPVAFQTFQTIAENAPSLQPLTIRYKNLPDGMVVYIVNDAPFSVEADFVFAADSQSTMSELTGHRMIRSISRNPQRSGTHTWRVSLLPYDLLAIRISDANAKIESVAVHRPPTLCGADGAFKRKVEELVQRVHAARNGVRWDGLVNADFELAFDMALRNDGTRLTVNDDIKLLPEPIILGWQCFGTGLTAQLDTVAFCKGQSSVKLTNNSSEPGTFLCEPIDIPLTGRLGVSMFVGIPANCTTLPMSVLLTAKHRGEPFHRSVPVEATLMPYLAKVEPKNGVRWHRLMVPFERLPMESLEEVRIGIHLAGTPAQTIWLDDVALYPVLFSSNEIIELQKMILVADERFSSGRVSGLNSLLGDYWVQFLFEHVPASLPQPRVATASPPMAKDVPAPPKPSPTFYQRVKGWVGM